MREVELKRLLISRIVKYLNPVPTNAVNDLLQQPLHKLETLLDTLVTQKEQGDEEEEAFDRVEEEKTQRAFDGAWGATLARVSLNGRYLCDVESNRSILEGLLNPGENPTPAIYSTLVLQFPTKFSWQTPQPKPTKEDQRAAFDAFVREHSLSSCEANFQLFRDGASIENFSGASGVERATRQEEAARTRQHFLIHEASPTQLKQEAAWESQQNRAAAVQAEADRQHQVSSQQQQQSGMFPPLPAFHAETGENIDARWLRKTSTINFELFKKLCRKHGSAAINERLRIPATPAV
jgi:hypothetical protein